MAHERGEDTTFADLKPKEERPTKASNILKPYLTLENFRMIGATTDMFDLRKVSLLFRKGDLFIYCRCHNF